jgi:hypothetical protein
MRCDWHMTEGGIGPAKPTAFPADVYRYHNGTDPMTVSGQ